MRLYDGSMPGTALVRCDFNIPLDGSNLSKIYDIKDTLSLLKKNKIILMTHIGNIDGYDINYSTKNIKQYVEEIIEEEISICNIDNIKDATSRIILLENLRFYKEERQNSDNFAQVLSELGDFYINDAFATCHRKHASLNAIKKYMICYIGCHLYNEIERLKPLLGKNYIWIIGGKKVRTKLNNVPLYSDVILGGVAANSYFQYHGLNIGKSLYVEYEMDRCNFIPPIDIITDQNNIKNIEDIKYDESIVDIGPKSIQEWKQYISNRPCIWNGSLAIDNHSASQRELMQYISENCSISIICGGDMYIPKELKFTHISNAGGALLYFMSHGVFENIN